MKPHRINLSWGGTLLDLGSGRYRVNWSDSNGHYHRVKIRASSLDEAIAMAEDVRHCPPREGSRAKPYRKITSDMHIHEVLIGAINSRNLKQSTRQTEIDYCKTFLRWIDRKSLSLWSHLSHGALEDYLHHLESQGLSARTIQLYLHPIRRASRWISAVEPDHYSDVASALRSPRSSVPERYRPDAGNPVLTIHQVLDLLDHLSRHETRCRLVAPVALQGLVGLSIHEVLRLTWDQVDLRDPSITIEGEVKNRFRTRKIPVPVIIPWLLRDLAATGTESLLFPHWSDYRHYSNAVRKAIHHAMDRGIIPPIDDFAPKDLRNTLQTEAIDGGWYGYYVQRYVGHTPTTIGEKHYYGDRWVRLEPHLREKVLAHIESQIASWSAPVATPILPGPRLVISGGLK